VPIPLDRRSRLESECQHLTIDAFFRDLFPRLAERNGQLVAEAMARLKASPLACEVGGESWSIIRDGETIAATRGTTPDAFRLALTAEQFSDCMQNLMSLNGMMTARQLKFADDELRQVSLWDSLILTLLDGWPTVGVDLDFVDRYGRPLDLGQSFFPDADPDDIAHFLREAGYLHLRGWFDPADMAAISADMDHAIGAYHEGDGSSWWAKLASGERVCVRMQQFEKQSPTADRLLNGEMWEKLRRAVAANDPVVTPPAKTRLIEALFKPVGVVSGPSDLTFHRDCHLGRHMYECSHITIGMAVTGTSRENGLLQVIAGSHRVALPVEIAKTEPYLPVVEVETEPGDITVHLSCTLHASTPPKLAPRRVMYTAFALAGTARLHGEKLGNLREQVSDIVRREQMEIKAQ
jgi:ectoine hydroxylase-related dioxygenase (phytanoyl-CoA dioxygenase family)